MSANNPVTENIKINNIKLICFDLDGTLVDSVPDLTLAINAMLSDLNLTSCQKEDVKNWVGDGIAKMVERAIVFTSENLPSAKQLEKAVVLFETYYQTFLNCESGLYPNVAKTIKVLSEKGYKIALVTNKAERFLPDLLNLYEIKSYFDLLLGGDTLAKNKPDPIMVNYACDYFNISKQQTVMIGDSRNDILAGQNAGVACIALTYGYNYGNPVSALNPDYIIDHFNQLLDLL
jgi:phosphoglycolate phosphatase